MNAVAQIVVLKRCSIHLSDGKIDGALAFFVDWSPANGILPALRVGMKKKPFNVFFKRYFIRNIHVCDVRGKGQE